MARGERIRGRKNITQQQQPYRRHIPLTKSSSSCDSNKSSDLFREAEDFIKDKVNTLLDQQNQAYLRGKMNDLLGIGYACGQATKKTARRAFNDDDETYESNDDDVDDGVTVNWRMDPRESMSNWTLIVMNMNDPSQPGPHIYHLHTAVLVFGERKSGFFEKAVTLQQVNGANGAMRGRNNVSEVTVDSYVAKFIPMMLDFIYADKLDLDVNSAPGLRQLACQFDVRHLYALVSSFIQNGLSEITVVSYMNEAEKVKDTELENVALQYAIQCFDLIPDDALGEISLHVMQQIVSDPKLFCPSSERLSQRVATYVRSRESEINEETFFFLTHTNLMPVIDTSEAIWLLWFGASNFMNTLTDESMGGYEVSLKRRCIIAASMDWRMVLLNSVQNASVARQHGNTDGKGVVGSPINRRRLFQDGGRQEEISGRSSKYLNLPDDIKVELLEEAFLKAASENDEYVNGSRINMGNSGNGCMYDRNGASNESYHSVDHRSDISKRDGMNGVRERAWY